VRYLDRSRLAADVVAGECVQRDAKMRVAVVDGSDLVADGDVDAKLFTDLAPQARAERLAGLALAAGELPQTAQHAVGPALRDQKAAVVAMEHACRHVEMRRAGAPLFDR